MGSHPFHVTLAQAMHQLPLPPTSKWPYGVWDAEMFRSGSMRVLVFAPKEEDFQTPHDQDELYVIVSGQGEYELDGSIVSFVAGDVLFAPSGVSHRFTRFGDDFVAWVIFWGPAGGETGSNVLRSETGATESKPPYRDVAR